MINPNFNRNQFIDDVLLNTAVDMVSGSIATLGAAVFQAGLLHPEAVTWTLSGLVADVTAPLPFETLFGSGIVASAHGTITGQDTQSYSADFTSFVPASGSITAYLVAEYSSIQQDPVQVTGPPPGHPDYTPSFQPYTGYSANVDSLNFVPTTSLPDNSTTFEIFRCTLAAGATGLTGISTSFQRRASPYPGQAMVEVSGNVVARPQNLGLTYVFTGPGTFTLPLAAQSNGLSVTIVSSAAATIPIPTQGSDKIFGTALAPGVGQSSTSVVQGGAVTLQAQFGLWQITGGTAAALGAGPNVPVGTMFFYGGPDLPSGCVFANGQLLNTADWPALFAKYGYSYGGSGSQFGVPDVRCVVLAGVDNMGSAGNRGLLSDFTNAGTIGAVIGSQNYSLNAGNLPGHTHNFSGTTGTENQSHNHNQQSNTGVDSNPGGDTGAWSAGGELSLGGVTGSENQSHNHNFSGTTDGGNGLNGSPFDIVQPTGMYPMLIKAA